MSLSYVFVIVCTLLNCRISSTVPVFTVIVQIHHVKFTDHVYFHVLSYLKSLFNSILPLSMRSLEVNHVISYSYQVHVHVICITSSGVHMYCGSMSNVILGLLKVPAYLCSAKYVSSLSPFCAVLLHDPYI